MDAPDLLYLTEDDVASLAPTPLEGIELAATALRAIAAGRCQTPPKSKVFHRDHPGAFTSGMPACDAVAGLLGVKWITAEPGNAEHGLPVVNGVMVMSDTATGLVRCIMGARVLTGLRTAAVSGACIRALAPDRAGSVAIIGTGVQARSHLPVIAALGYREVRLWGRRRESVDGLLEWAREAVPSIEVAPAPSMRAAVEDAAVVITAITQGVDVARVDATWLRADALLVPVDYGATMPGSLAAERLFLADDPQQFAAVRAVVPALAGYRDPDGPSGAYLDGHERPRGVLVQNLGSAAADVHFADAVIRRADERGIGARLPR